MDHPPSPPAAEPAAAGKPRKAASSYLPATGTCPVCGVPDLRLRPGDGLVRHGARGNPCPGEGRTPQPGTIWRATQAEVDAAAADAPCRRSAARGPRRWQVRLPDGFIAYVGPQGVAEGKADGIPGAVAEEEGRAP